MAAWLGLNAATQPRNRLSEARNFGEKSPPTQAVSVETIGLLQGTQGFSFSGGSVLGGSTG